jgi:hypothetical protein
VNSHTFINQQVTPLYCTSSLSIQKILLLVFGLLLSSFFCCVTFVAKLKQFELANDHNAFTKALNKKEYERELEKSETLSIQCKLEKELKDAKLENKNLKEQNQTLKTQIELLWV